MAVLVRNAQTMDLVQFNSQPSIYRLSATKASLLVNAYAKSDSLRALATYRRKASESAEEPGYSCTNRDNFNNDWKFIHLLFNVYKYGIKSCIISLFCDTNS
ncbi:hypothetical protein AVEN_94623-1 [Araneus ventricosus]|uniref:Uncharacterized protein n=1 Tax=Araneus ventricosus TaxID=182803 RepID=A0A4Y2ME85_ARAVE|nr:hypothetical protein AVEN_94623-1 [Araneus ventricosus]